MKTNVKVKDERSDEGGGRMGKGKHFDVKTGVEKKM